MKTYGGLAKLHTDIPLTGPEAKPEASLADLTCREACLVHEGDRDVSLGLIGWVQGLYTGRRQRESREEGVGRAYKGTAYA